MRRKIRTREHVIADLAINHVERQVLLCGYSVERVVHDYGIDLVLFTYGPTGEVENGLIFLQVKATERSTRVSRGQAVSFRVERSDLQHWLHEYHPVILIVYDVSMDTAWWLHVHPAFRLPGFDLFRAGKTVAVRLPISQVFDPAAVRQLGVIRDRDLR
jgi:hypothetical protein